LALALAAAPAGAAPPAAGQDAAAGRPVTKYPLPTDSLFTPAPAVPPRRAYQPGLPPPEAPEPPGVTLPPGSEIPLPRGKANRYSYTPRYGTRIDVDSQVLPDGTRRSVITGGVIISVKAVDGFGHLELATDDAVVWVRGLPVDNILNGFQTTADGKQEVEAYLSGNVVVRTKSADGPPLTLRAEQVYYDPQLERAVAVRADLEFAPPQAPDPFHFRAEEVRRLDAENWEALDGSFHASKLPSDPGVRVDARRLTYSEREVRLRNAFGIPYRDLLTGQRVYGREQLVTAYGAVPRVAGVPVGYFPRVRTDATDPLGPFAGFSFGQNRIFGTQFYTTWDLFDVLALRPPPGHKWRLNLDYLSNRGPAAGTDYFYNLPPADPALSGTTGLVQVYGIADHGTDILGGDRGPQPVPPDFRGRATWRHQQEILQGLYFQGQVSYLSDQNFLEQYYKQEFDLGPNQETFAYLTYNARNYWLAGLVEPKLDRPWIGETQWLPRLDGALVGQSFFDLFVYNARANAAWAMARPSTSNPFPLLTTDQRIDTGRFDLMQELSVPFALGPVKLAPYGVVDLAAYTRDLNGDGVGRVWGGGGNRASLAFSRLYEDAASDLFNVRGIYHKAVLGTNYLYARSNVPYTQLPYLDRLNDDATDQAWRNIIPFEPQYIGGTAGLLLSQAGNPASVYNPQQYAIRRGITNKVDTLDDLHVLQLDLRQRLQTKRGYPGLEHTVDVVTLGTSVSYFPDTAANFGNPFAFAEYDFLWNIGDRTALLSNGWFEPYDEGSRYWNVGLALNRTDRTNFYVGFRHIDPLKVRAVTAAVGYQLSRRYYLNASTSYDFGTNLAQSNSVTLTRTGTDLTVSVGFTYNALVNNFGFQFLVAPNILAALSPGRLSGTPAINSMSGGRNR
jgi:hypothetical protein